MKLIKKIFEIYKVPLLVSLTLFIALMALLVMRDPVNIFLAILGCFMGAFILDLDYIIYAYFTDPEKTFSETLRGYIKHGDYPNVFSYIYYHRDDVEEKTLQSVLFQVVLAGLTFFIVFAPLSVFAKALILSTYANSLYRLAELLARGNYKEWFWVLKEKPSERGVKLYIGASLILLLIVLQFL